MVELKKYGFEQLGEDWFLKEGIYTLMYSKRGILGKSFPTFRYIEKLELYAENKDGEMILLGEIEGEESLKTILNLIKQ
jgi:hypothetical protein